MGNLADPIVFRHRGRDLTMADIASVQATIAAHYARGRTFIGLRLCEQWDWRQSNGQYKAFAARDLLLPCLNGVRLDFTLNRLCDFTQDLHSALRGRDIARISAANLTGGTPGAGRPAE